MVASATLVFESRLKIRHKAKVVAVYVGQRARGRGLGRQLVEGLLAEARSRREVSLVQLTVVDGNRAAERLYASCGFDTFGVEPRALRVAGRFVPIRHMWLELG